MNNHQHQNHNLYSAFFERTSVNARVPLLETADGTEYTYADAQALSSQFAACLTELGVQVGDRVTVQVEKSPEALWLYLACLKAGVVFHPLNTAYQASELRYFINDAKPRLVVCDSRNESLLRSLADEMDTPPAVLTLDADGRGSLPDAVRHCPTTSFTPVQCQPDDLAALLYSSGTTGRPKGIMLTHQNLIANTEALIETWGLTAEDRLLHALPIFHVHGLFVAIGCVLMRGASMLWLPAFQAEQVQRFLPSCSLMMGVPTYYSRLLENPDFGRDHCSHCRLFISGSAPLPEAVFKAFQQRTGHTILERYGMTETGMNTSNPLQGERKVGTVGPPLPGVTVRVVDGEGRPVAIDARGNVQVKGPNVFKGYWHLPEKTAEDFTDDGFFNTGDKGKIDADGYLSIVGRAKDMIISGGLNIYPKEIEQVLDTLDSIKMSAVIGVPQADFGEAVVAVVVKEDGNRHQENALTEQDVIEAVRVELAGFKVPKKVMFVEALPFNTMGKVQKNLLRERYATCGQSE